MKKESDKLDDREKGYFWGVYLKKSKVYRGSNTFEDFVKTVVNE